MSKLKVLFVLNTTRVTSIPVEQANSIGKKCDVTIMSLFESQECAEEHLKTTGKNCKVIGCNYSKNKIKGLLRYRNVIKTGNYDIIHTHHTLSGMLARLIAFNKGRSKVVHTVHANHHSYSFFQNLVIGMTMNKCDAVTFNSNSSQIGLYDWQKKRIKRVYQETIYNGIDTERIRLSSNSFFEQTKKKFNIKDDDFIFIQVGRLIDVKDPLLSLHAFNKCVLDTSKKIKYIYIGDGYLREKIEQVVKEYRLDDKVFITGVIERENVYSIMNNVDALVVTSKYEGFCNALFEGMAAGDRLIIPQIPVFEETIPQDDDIVRFPSGNSDDLAERMKQVLFDSWNNSQKEKWNKFVYDRFGIDSISNRYVSLYEKILRS